MTGVLFGVLFFFGAVGLAAVGWGISISQDDSSSYPSWTDTALIPHFPDQPRVCVVIR